MSNIQNNIKHDIQHNMQHDIQHNIKQMNHKNIKGFSLVELLVALVVGVIIVGGAFSLHLASRTTQQVNEAQMDMVADARFAIELITYDLRHAGMWGATNQDGLVTCRSTDATCVGAADEPGAAANDCAPGWYRNLSFAVFATDNSNSYSATCIPGSEKYQAGTDVLDIRFADSNLPIGGLAGGQAYVRSNFANGRVFVGTTQPVLAAQDSAAVTNNFVLHAYSYYVSSFTDTTGDGIPSLRRVALVNGPGMQNQTLISGVVDLQVQFGIDEINDDEIVDRYVDPSTLVTQADWQKVYSAKIWLVMQSDKKQDGIDTSKTFSIAGADKSFGGVGGYRHFMTTSVVDLRNLKQL